MLVITKPARAKAAFREECLSASVKGMKGQIKLNKVIDPPKISASFKNTIHLLVLLSSSQ